MGKPRTDAIGESAILTIGFACEWTFQISAHDRGTLEQGQDTGERVILAERLERVSGAVAEHDIARGDQRIVGHAALIEPAREIEPRQDIVACGNLFRRQAPETLRQGDRWWRGTFEFGL